jgi:hypothetical protein
MLLLVHCIGISASHAHVLYSINGQTLPAFKAVPLDLVHPPNLSLYNYDFSEIGSISFIRIRGQDLRDAVPESPILFA